MIVKMDKMFVVARDDQRQALLEGLAELGVLHVMPVEASRAVTDERIVSAIDRMDRAIQVLSEAEPGREAPDVSPDEAAAEVLRIQQAAAEGRSHLNTLYRQLEQLADWGEVRLEQLAQLKQSGVEIRFYAVPEDQLGEIQGECVEVIRPLPDRRALVAIVDRTGRAQLPEESEQRELPERDRPSIRAQARQIDKSLTEGAQRLGQLARLLPEMRKRRDVLKQEGDFNRTQRSALENPDLFAVQGWVPAQWSGELGDRLAALGAEAAIEISAPGPEDQPPTLIRYPRWAKPIKGLFDILGTVPGYRDEFDLSGFFMIALPIFVAMLIGDAGYGLLFTLPPLIFYRRLRAKLGADPTNLILCFGIATIAWGALTANYFGISPREIAAQAGFLTTHEGAAVGDVAAMADANAGGWAAVGRAMLTLAPLYREDPDASRNIVILISFILGTIHMVSAQLRRGLELAPDARALANVGWAIFLVGMFGVVCHLLLAEAPELLVMPISVIAWLLGLGGVLVLVFSYPSRNPLKRLGLGFVANLLPVINAFSDTMSYIRLMAVGLASYYIAFAFNGLAAQVASSATWFVAWPILVFGHGMNIALGLVAIFAHGVRLNMLEFSNNAGVQWSGYPYTPFAKTVR